MSRPNGRSMIPPVILLVLMAGISCSQPDTVPAIVPTPDYWPTDGWRTSTPEEQGMDSQRLAQMLAEITEHEIAINTMLIVRNGYLVMEANVWPFQSQARHMIMSITKSVTSALVGMTIEQGFIKDVEQPVLSFSFEGRDATVVAASSTLGVVDRMTGSQPQ